VAASVRKGFAMRFEKAMGGMWCQASHPGVVTVAQWILSLPEDERKDWATRALDGFFLDEFAKKTGFAIGLLAKCPQKYAGPPKPKLNPILEEFRRERAEREKRPWN
jgi:hypothetical protein